MAFSNADLTGSDRFDCWREINAQSLMPVLAKSETESDFDVSMHVLAVDDVQLSKVRYGSLWVDRTARLIRRTDPEAYQINLFLQGSAVVSQSGREAKLGPGQFVVIDSSKPCQARRSCSADAPSFLLQVPRRSLQLPQEVHRGLAAVPFDARHGLGAMFCQWLQNTIAQAHEFSARHATTLATMTTDLFSAVVTDALGTTAVATPEARQRILWLRIDRFIENHLGDPDLTPATIAAAHHISLRSLQQLFAAAGHTPAASIRRRRLERCRRDLARPQPAPAPRPHHRRSVELHRKAHFSRLFRATYGMSATEYRHSQS